MSLLNSINSVNISNLMDVLEDVKTNGKNKDEFIAGIGDFKEDNGYGSYIVNLNNSSLTAIGLSVEKSSGVISALSFSHPQLSLAELISLCPNAAKKYNPHDEEYSWVASKDGFFITATVDEKERIYRLSVQWGQFLKI